MTRYRARSRLSPHLLTAAAALATVGLAACASSGAEFETPPEVRPPVVDDVPATAEESPQEPESTEDSKTIVIEDESAEDAARRTLLETAREERERRRSAPAPHIVITDENLAEHAIGELTTAAGDASPEEGEGDETEQPESEMVLEIVPSEPDDETYWRNRAREARMEWKTSVEEVEHLERRVAELRRRFYEEDDPYYRDTQIKPAWDSSLARLGEARDAAEASRIRVLDTLEEGRRAGALPGWLREGIDLEPDLDTSLEAEQDPQEHESQEPSVVEAEEPGGR